MLQDRRRRSSSSIRRATLLRSWGGQDGPGYQWPDSNHGLNIDNKGNVWIGGNGGQDGHILKFTQDGKFVMQVGKKGVTQNSMAQDHFFQVAKTFFHAPANEVYVADGYGNRRVAVIDAETGKMKRFWGAYGNPPDDKASSAQGAYDPTVDLPAVPRPGALREGLDRRPRLRLRPHQQPHPGVQDRRHVRPRDLHAARLARRRLDVGRRRSRRDPQQRFLYVADGRNQKIRIFDRATHDAS